jgi:hypothetical protein
MKTQMNTRASLFEHALERRTDMRHSNKITITLLFVVLLTSLPVVGKSGAPQGSLAGRWASDQGDMVNFTTKSGTFFIHGQSPITNGVGDWGMGPVTDLKTNARGATGKAVLHGFYYKLSIDFVFARSQSGPDSDTLVLSCRSEYPQDGKVQVAQWPAKTFRRSMNL